MERSVQSIGRSLFVSLPKSWTKTFGVKKGSKLRLVTSEKGSLTIAPTAAVTEKKKAVLVYDEHFNRHFFREYFEGDDTIVIKIGKDRKKLHSFLSRFMNVQVVEETSSKVVVKCFKIDLTMDECLKRMFYLSLSLFDQVDQETRNNVTRFYYMLVMQVRRYLTEGQFADSNVSLIRAMDIRMAAERIQRVCEELSNGNSSDKEYYKKAVNSFLTEDFSKASPLWVEGRKRKTAIARYAKEISMLVR